MAIVCLNTLSGIGEVCEQATPITITSGFFLTRPDFEFSSFSSFATQADWLTGIVDNKIFPVQGVKDEEPMDFEDSVTDTPSGDKVFNFEGRRGKRFKILLPLEMHKVLRTYDRKNFKIFYLDRNNNIRGTTPDGTKVTGFSLNYFRIPKQQSPYPDNPAYSYIEVQELDINEWDRNGVYVNPTWLGSTVKGVLTVEATPSTVATNDFTVAVSYVDNSGLTSAGANTTAAISGLVAANFEVIDQTGAVVTPEKVTESTTTPGTYTIETSAMTSGSVQVIPSSTALFKSEVETVSAAT